jgi:hypothetical protein
LASFRDELTQIHRVKLANLSGAQNSNQVPVQAAPPPAALGSVKVKAPPKGGTLGGTKPTYSKVNSIPTSSPAAGQQNLATPPPVKA